MSKFKFKLDSLIRVKEKLKLKVNRELVQINLIINEKKSEIESIINELDSFRNYKLNQINSSDIKFIEYYKITLSSKIKDLEKQLIELYKKKENKLKLLSFYAKELKVLEQLKQKKKNDFDKEMNKIEIKIFDEIALQNFVRD